MKMLSSCPSCNSIEIATRYRGKTTRDPADGRRWNVAECKACSLGFMNPRPDWSDLEPYYSPQYAPYQPSYSASSPSDDETLAQARAAGTFRHIDIPEGKRVLDVGCGGGYFLRICAKLGATVQGVDPSPIAAAQARAQGIEVFNGLLEDFDTQDRFDVITMSQVLEHTPDPVGTLKKMKSLLAPGGMIWIGVPNADCEWAKKLTWRWDGADLPYHLIQFGPASLREVVRRAELEITRMYTDSKPWIVAFTMQKYLRTRYLVPHRISHLFVTERWAQQVGREMDEKNEGDTLIVELRA